MESIQQSQELFEVAGQSDHRDNADFRAILGFRSDRVFAAICHLFSDARDDARLFDTVSFLTSISPIPQA